MAKFLFGTTPLVGAVGTALKIAAALVERGHEVRWYTGRRFKARVEATGATYEPMKLARDYSEEPLFEAFPQLVGKTGVAALKANFKHVFIEPSRAQLEDVKAILKDYAADATLSDSVFLAFALAHDLGGPPWAKFGDSVLGIRSHDTAPHGLGLWPSSTRLGRLRNIVLHNWFGKILMADVRAKNDAIRADLGLRRGPSYFYEALDSPYLWLQCSVPSFEYPRSDLPPHVHFIGPVVPDAAPDFERPAWWTEIEEHRTPIVHVTQGTVSTNARALLFPTFDALANEPVLVVASTGGTAVDEVMKGRTLPSNARIAAFLPHAELLPHVDLMITNAGNNGVQAALAHGVPIVAAGNTEEKPEVAARVAWSGIGIDLRTGRPSPEQIRAAVRRVLHERAFRERASLIQKEIAAHDPAREAAALLEELAATKKAVPRKP